MAWEKWQFTAAELARQQFLLQGALNRLLKRAMSMAWEKWQQVHADITAEKRTTSAALHRFLNRQLSMAWEKWQQVCADIRSQKRTLARALQRMMSRQLSTAWEEWKQVCHDARLIESAAVQTQMVQQRYSYAFLHHIQRAGTLLSQLHSSWELRLCCCNWSANSAMALQLVQNRLVHSECAAALESAAQKQFRDYYQLQSQRLANNFIMHAQTSAFLLSQLHLSWQLKFGLLEWARHAAKAISSQRHENLVGLIASYANY